jgi:hypothetical protein
VAAADHLGGALTDNDARGHGVARRNARHNRPIGDTKAIYAVNRKIVVSTDVESRPILAVQVWWEWLTVTPRNTQATISSGYTPRKPRK